MLKLPSFEQINFSESVENLRGQIPLLTSEWTDFNHHDPGITTLQVMTWLTDNLNYYIHASGEEHKQKYLKLLGMQSSDSVAKGNVWLESDQGDLLIPRGTRISASETVFEFIETYQGKNNRVIGLYGEADGKISNLLPFIEGSDDFVEIVSFQSKKDGSLYIGFEQPLKENESLYVKIADNLMRNPFDVAFSLSEIEWAVYTAEGWSKIEDVKDGTCGLLKSGEIAFSKVANQSAYEEREFTTGYYLRGKLIENSYDLLPQIGRITTNFAPVEQSVSHIECIDFTYQGKAEIEIDYYIRESHRITVLVQNEDGDFVLWYEPDNQSPNKCDIAKTDVPWKKTLVFDKVRFGEIPNVNRSIKLVFTDLSIFEKSLLGFTEGYANQILEVEIPSLSELKVALVHKTKKGVIYEIWDNTAAISCAGYTNKVFEYNKDRSSVVFGDSIHGVQPDPGFAVIIIGAKSSKFGDGNVRKDHLAVLEKSFSHISAGNPFDITGGQFKEDSTELAVRLEEHLFRLSSAVTKEDYIAIVTQTPGLMIDLVGVVNGKKYSQFYDNVYSDHTVYLVVKPYSPENKRPELSEKYKKIISNHIQQYRQLTTNIEVRGVKYLPLEITGQIVLKGKTSDKVKAVEDMIYDFIENYDQSAFGKTVSYSQLLSLLSVSGVVEKIEGLSISPLGMSGVKNQQGDITLFPDILPFVKNIAIEYTERVN